jgi:hypothetical protein
VGAVIRSWISTAPLLRHLGRPRSPWTKGDLLTAAGVVVAVVAIVVSAVQSRSNDVGSSALDEARRANDIAASAQVLRPGLQISAIAAHLTDGISGTISGPDGTTTTRSDLPGPKIDITLANPGSGSSLITAAVLEVSDSRHLEPCVNIGGAVEVSMNYDVPIPDPSERSAPFTVTRDMRFEVESGKHDRFTLTVGPRTVVEGVTPMLLIVAVTLIHDGGSALPAGTFAVVDTGDNSNFYPKPQGGWELLDAASVTSKERECFRRNARLVHQILRRPGVTASTELMSLDTALRVY